METLATVLSVVSGFVLMGHKAPPLDIVITSTAVDLALAPLTATIAYRRGRSALAWLAIGLCSGMWGLAAALIALPAQSRHDKSPTPPPRFPTSDAA